MAWLSCLCIYVYVYSTSPPKRLNLEQNVTSVTPPNMVCCCLCAIVTSIRGRWPPRLLYFTLRGKQIALRLAAKQLATKGSNSNLEQNVTSVTPLIWSGVAYVQLWPQSEAIDLWGHYTLFDKQYKIGIYWQVSWVLSSFLKFFLTSVASMASEAAIWSLRPSYRIW